MKVTIFIFIYGQNPDDDKASLFLKECEFSALTSSGNDVIITMSDGNQIRRVIKDNEEWEITIKK